MRAFHLLFGSYVLFLLVSSFLGEAQSDHGVYIVYMGARINDHAQLVSQMLMDREIDSLVHTYGKSFSGFAAHLSDKQAESIAQQPEVVSVFRDQTSKLHTTRSWDFLMSQNAQLKYDSNPMMNSQSLSCSIGDDTIIGIFDTGIWPEHPSFNDKLIKDPIPTRWKGECMPDNNISIPFKCNRKLIGARYYNNNGTARDAYGHGTHVASTAAGSPVWGASYKGLAEGVARGGSPCSRIAAYNVVYANKNITSSYILKAFDDAIADGVDVISVSLGFNNEDFFHDVIALGSFHAVEKRIIVVCSVGNSGYSPGTIENFAPWILSVGATTIDRVLQVSIVLGGGNSGVIQGMGMYFGEGLKQTISHPLTDGRSARSNQARVADAINCIPGSLDDAKVRGKIVLCTDEFESEKVGESLKKQGAIGVIIISEYFYELTFDFTDILPFVAVSEGDGAKIKSYLNSIRNPSATFFPTQTIINFEPAPVIALFSSRGPPRHGMHNIVKPDVVAPGVNILAGVPPITNDGLLFDIYSGTSMSCPHVSGVAAMLKSVHPTWSPSAIRSSIMTTAIQTNNLPHSPIQTHNGSTATPYDIGAGEINPVGSLWRPGLVYETSTADYVQFLCNMGYKASAIRTISPSTVPNDFSCPSNSNPDLISDMNYPSIAVSGLKAKGSCRTVKRTVTNVGEACSTYTATVVAPTNVLVQVVPNILRFTKNVKTLTFQVSFNLTATSRDDMFGSITWCNGKYINVRSPFVVSKT